jgi:hypothetical protein
MYPSGTRRLRPSNHSLKTVLSGATSSATVVSWRKSRMLSEPEVVLAPRAGERGVEPAMLPFVMDGDSVPPRVRLLFPACVPAMTSVMVDRSTAKAH